MSGRSYCNHTPPATRSLPAKAVSGPVAMSAIGAASTPSSQHKGAILANPWFRLYSEFADDPRVQMMSEAMQRRLVMLMCFRCKDATMHETQLAFYLRISAAELADTKRVFLQNGFIDEDWKLVNWNRCQFVSDSSTERSRRSRQRKQQAATLHSDPEPSDLDGDVTEGNVTVTASDTEQSQKQTQTQRQSARAQAKADARRISQAVNPEATADLSEIAERIAVLHPRSQLKHIVPTQVPAKDSQAIVAAILLEAAKSDMKELEAGEMLLRMVEELAATVPREQWHFLKPVTAYFAEFEYRREPTTFLRSTRAKEAQTMANDKALNATQTLYESFWRNTSPAQAISQSLDQLAEGFEKRLTAATYRLYAATLADLTQADCVQAFSRAALNLRFFPPPATLREFSGRAADGDAVARETKAEVLPGSCEDEGSAIPW